MKMLAYNDLHASYHAHQPTNNAEGPTAPCAGSVDQLLASNAMSPREDAAYAAIECFAHACGIFLDPDDPEQAHVAAVKRAVMRRLTRR